MSNAVRKILEDHLIAEWGVTTPIAWDDFNYIPKPGTPFIRVTLDGIGADPLSLSCQREEYLLSIQVFTKDGEGPKDNMTLTDQLTGIFFGFAEGNLHCKRVVTERVGTYKEWFQRNVLVDVQFDNHIIV